MTRLEVRIDELVLEGVPAHEAPAVAEALRVELTRLLAAELAPAIGGGIPGTGPQPEGAHHAGGFGGVGRAPGAPAGQSGPDAAVDGSGDAAGAPGTAGDPAGIAAAAARAVHAAVWRALRPADRLPTEAGLERSAGAANPWAGVRATTARTRPAVRPGVTAGNPAGGVA